MLDSISGTQKRPAAARNAPTTKPPSTVSEPSIRSPSQNAVVVSITTTVVAVTGTAPATVAAPTAVAASASAASCQAEQQAQRGLQALSQIATAKDKADSTIKKFLQEKMDGLQKQLQLLRVLGRSALDIAKGSVSLAHEVAKTVSAFAAATIDQNSTDGNTSADTTGTTTGAGADGNVSEDAKTVSDHATAPNGQNSTGTIGTNTGITAKEALQQAGKLQTEAANSLLTGDATPNNPQDVPTDPDDHFFYDAYRLLDQVKKTLVETQRIDTYQHGTNHAQAFKKLNQRENDLEQAVTDAYVAMKTDGSLDNVNQAITADSASSSNLGILA